MTERDAPLFPRPDDESRREERPEDDDRSQPRGPDRGEKGPAPRPDAASPRPAAPTPTPRPASSPEPRRESAPAPRPESAPAGERKDDVHTGAGPNALTRPLPSVPSAASRLPRESPPGPQSGAGAGLHPRSEPSALRRPDAARSPLAPPLRGPGPAAVTPRPGSQVPSSPDPGPTKTEPAVLHPERAREPGPSAEPAELVHALVPARRQGGMRRVVRFAPRSVFRVALVFYLAVLIAFLAAGTVLYVVLQVTGTMSNLESFFEDISGYESAEFLFVQTLLFFSVAGLVWVLFATLGTTFLAVLYNRASRLVGGLRVMVDDDDEPKTRPGLDE